MYRGVYTMDEEVDASVGMSSDVEILGTTDEGVEVAFRATTVVPWDSLSERMAEVLLEELSEELAHNSEAQIHDMDIGNQT